MRVWMGSRYGWHRPSGCLDSGKLSGNRTMPARVNSPDFLLWARNSESSVPESQNSNPQFCRASPIASWFHPAQFFAHYCTIRVTETECCMEPEAPATVIV